MSNGCDATSLQFLFADRAAEIIADHATNAAGQPLFLYLPLQVEPGFEPGICRIGLVGFENFMILLRP